MEYTYDAMYQLINATGRKHSGVIADKSGCGFGNSKYIKLGTLHINDSEKLKIIERCTDMMIQKI